MDASLGHVHLPPCMPAMKEEKGGGGRDGPSRSVDRRRRRKGWMNEGGGRDESHDVVSEFPPEDFPWNCRGDGSGIPSSAH